MDPDSDADSDADPDPDSSLTFKMPRKTKKLFCLYSFEGTFTSFFKDKESNRIHKAVGIKIFLTISVRR